MHQLISQIVRLESRRHLDAVMGEDGIVTVTGTPDADNIQVNYNASTLSVDINVNGDIDSFPTNLILEIRVEALAGDDFVKNRFGRSVNICGDEGNDTLWGGAGGAVLLGGIGDDLLHGGGGSDYFYPDRDNHSGNDVFHAGNDTIFGYGGSDTTHADIGSDVIDGGSDGTYEDVVRYSLRTADLSLSLDGIANDGEAGETGNLINIEEIVGGQADNLYVGDDQANRFIDYSFGVDTMIGNGGDDFFYSTSGEKLCIGGSGNDEFQISSESNQTLLGGSGDDNIPIKNGFADGGSGDDYFSAIGSGTATLNGQGGDDTFYLDGGDPDFPSSRLINGGGGHDAVQINDSSGYVHDGYRATLGSESNHDNDDGRRGGDDSDDIMLIEKITGNNGDDFLDASDLSKAVILIGARENDTQSREGGDDTLIGGSGADLLEGLQGDDSLVGNGGNDRLRGGAENDFLNGSAGADRYVAGAGNDTLIATDGTIDFIDGGTGTDEGDLDNNDDDSRVEILI